MTRSAELLDGRIDDPVTGIPLETTMGARMSIGSLYRIALQQAKNAVQGTTLENSRKSADFQRILDIRAASPGQLQDTVQPLARLMADSEVRMLRSLFSDEDESAPLTLLPTIPQSQRSQIIDRYRQAQQPSLRDPLPAGRPQIDRMIDRVAAEVSLAPELIHAVVAAESSYDPNAVSPAGARGLMQLMPETATELGVRDSFDAQENLRGGSRYLKQLLDKYDGDLDRALAAYNWGQGNVDRQGLEKMPGETRAYLSRVKSQFEHLSA